MRLLPAILRGTHVFDFPRPVLSCRMQDSWDFLRFKVPLKPGHEVHGASRDGAMISIDGQFGSSQGALRLSEEEMLDAVTTLRHALDVLEQTKFDLRLFQSSNGAKRYLKNCVTSRLEIDFSNPSLFSYSVMIQATDPNFYL